MQEKLQALEQDPRFLELSFPEQAKVRAAVFADVLSRDPRAKDLSEDQFMSLVDVYAKQPPRFKNPAVQALADSLWSRYKTDPSGVVKFADAFTSDNLLYQTSLWAATQVEKLLGRQPVAGQSYEALYGEESAKFKDWLRSIHSPGGLSSFLGGATQVMITLPMIRSNPAIGGLLDKIETGLASKALSSGLRSQIYKGLVWSFAQNTIEDISLTGLQLVSKAWQGEDVADLGTVVRLYKDNAILDYLIGFASSVVWPIAKLSGKAMKAWLKGRKDYMAEAMSRVPIEDSIKKYISGELPEEISSRLPEYYADNARLLKKVQDIQSGTKRSASLLEEHPTYRVAVEARMAGFDPGLDKYGSFILRKVKDIQDNKDLPEVFFSPLQAHEEIALQIAKNIEKDPKTYSLDMFGPSKPIIHRLSEVYKSLEPAVEAGKKAPPNPMDVGHIAELEASKFVSDGKGAVYRVIEISEEGLPVLGKDPKGEVLGIFSKTASPEDFKRSLDFATKLAQEGSLLDPPRLQALDSLRRQGFDSVDLGEGKILGLYSRTVIPLQEKLSQVSFKPRTLKAPETTDAYIKMTVSKAVETDQLLQDPKKISLLLSSSGEVPSKQAQVFAESLLEPAKAKGFQVEFLQASEKLTRRVRIETDLEAKKISVSLPEKLELSDRQALVNGLRKTLKKTLEAKDLPEFSRIALRKTGSELKTLKLPFETFAENAQFVADSYEKFFGRKAQVNPDGSFSARGKTYPSLEAATQDLIISSLRGEGLKVALAEDGLKLVKDAGVYKILSTSGEILGTGRTPTEALKVSGHVPSKIPHDFLPQVIIQDANQTKITYTKTITAGSYNDLIRFLAKFGNPRLDSMKQVLEQTPEAFRVRLPDRSFEIHLPKAGVIEKFTDPREAIEFLRGGWARAEGIRRVLDRRGLPFRIEDGSYVTFIDGKKVSAKIGDKKQIEKLLASLPDLSTAPALLGEEMEDILTKHGYYLPAVGPLADPFYPPKIKERIGALEIASKLYPTPLSSWISDKLAKTGQTELSKSFSDLLDRYRVYQKELQHWRRQARAILSPEGKTLSAKQREGLRWWLEAKSEPEKLALAKEFDLDEKALEVGRNIRRLFGENPGDGLFALFGIDPIKFLRDYVPRIRQSVEELAAKKISLTPENIFAQAFPKGVPREIKFFAEMDRIEELLSFDAEKDIGIILDRYLAQGLKKKFLNPVWRELDSLRRKQAKAGMLDPQIGIALDEFRETIMGYKTVGEKSLEEFSSRFFSKLGLGDSVLAKDFARVLFTVHTFSSMAWRPWAAIRNIVDIYRTLAAPYGTQYVAKAIQKVAKNPDVFIAKGRELGILLDMPPLIHSIIDEANLAGRLTHRGLAAYGTSDALTRSVAMATAQEIFKEGFDKFKRGVLKRPEDLITYVKAYRFPDIEQAKIVELVKQGKYLAARDYYSRLVVEDSLFAYEKIHNPRLYAGLMGRLLGQFGVYPVQYIQNVRRGLTKGPLADRIAYASRLVASSTVLLGVFSALGIDASRDFTIWGPAQFGGGPVFNLILNAYRSMGEGYEAEIARGNLAYQAKSLPLRTVKLNQVLDFLEYLDKGDGWAAWLSLTGAPLKEELRQ